MNTFNIRNLTGFRSVTFKTHPDGSFKPVFHFDGGWDVIYESREVDFSHAMVHGFLAIREGQETFAPDAESLKMLLNS